MNNGSLKVKEKLAPVLSNTAFITDPRGLSPRLKLLPSNAIAFLLVPILSA